MIKKLSYKDIFKTFFVLVIPIVLVNVALYYLGESLGAFPSDVMSMQGEIVVGAVIGSSIIGSLLATILFAVVRLFVKNTAKWARIIGYILLLLSFANPFVIENANICLLYTSPSPRDQRGSRMPSSA